MPKGRTTTISPVYAGIQEDLESFLATFLENNTSFYTDFRDLFYSENMDRIFEGREEISELIEFNQYLLAECTKFVHNPLTPANFRTKLFGIFCLYTFYYLQPDLTVVQIRLTPDTVYELKRFMELELKPRGHLDAYTCAMKLFTDDATQIVAFLKLNDPMQIENPISERKSPVLKQHNSFGFVEDSLVKPEIQQMYELHNIYATLMKNMPHTDEYVEILDDPKEMIMNVMERHKKALVQYNKKKAEKLFTPRETTRVEQRPASPEPVQSVKKYEEQDPEEFGCAYYEEEDEDDEFVTYFDD